VKKAMRKTMRVGVLAMLLVNSSWSVVQAEDISVQATGSSSVEITEEMNLLSLIEKIATLGEFADWRGAAALPLRSLEDPNGGQAAMLWQVVQAGQEMGFVVTSPEGHQVYEASKRAVPPLPETLAGASVRYLYGGPMLHLVEVQGHGAEARQFYNLMTGERMPAFAIALQSPNAPAPGRVQQPAEQTIPLSAAPADDALCALGFYGLQQAKGGQDLQSLTTFTDSGSLAYPAFVVYQPAPGLQVSLAISKLLFYGEQSLVGLNDPFAEQGQPPVYVDSRFPVDVISLQVGSHT
jgi:hypothetical protein